MLFGYLTRLTLDVSSVVEGFCTVAILSPVWWPVLPFLFARFCFYWNCVLLIVSCFKRLSQNLVCSCVGHKLWHLQVKAEGDWKNSWESEQFHSKVSPGFNVNLIIRRSPFKRLSMTKLNIRGGFCKFFEWRKVWCCRFYSDLPSDSTPQQPQTNIETLHPKSLKSSKSTLCNDFQDSKFHCSVPRAVIEADFQLNFFNGARSFSLNSSYTSNCHIKMNLDCAHIIILTANYWELQRLPRLWRPAVLSLRCLFKTRRECHMRMLILLVQVVMFQISKAVVFSFDSLRCDPSFSTFSVQWLGPPMWRF